MARLMEHILPSNATLFERTLSEQHRPLLDIEVPIRDIWDPWKCPPHFLTYLAWSHSVDVWDPEWPEEKKRQVIDDAIEDHKRKGTLDGLRRYIAHAGGKLERITTPPQFAYGMDEWDEAEKQNYLDQLDELRIYNFYPVDIEADGLFMGDGFLDDEFLNSEPAWHGYRKTARLFRPDGSSVDLDISFQLGVDQSGRSVDFETIYLPGEPEAGLFAGEDFAGEDFYDEDRLDDRLIHRTSEHQYLADYGRLQFGTVFPDGREIGVKSELVTELADDDGVGLFASDGFYGDNFYMPDTGWSQIYERYWVKTPGVTVAAVNGGGVFYDDVYYGWEDFTAHAHVELLGYQPTYGADEFWDEGFFLPPELERFNLLLDAVAASQALRDKVLVTTTTHRWPRLGDMLPLDGSWPLGEMIKDR